MINETRTLDETIGFLNELLALDVDAVSALMCNARVPCGDALANHPTVQVGLQPGTTKDDGLCDVGLLGVLNGLFGTLEGGRFDGWGPLCADVDPVCPHCGMGRDELAAGGWKPGDEHCPMCCKALAEPVVLGWRVLRFRRTG